MYRSIGTIIGGGVVLVGAWVLLYDRVELPTEIMVPIPQTRVEDASPRVQGGLNPRHAWPSELIYTIPEQPANVEMVEEEGRESPQIQESEVYIAAVLVDNSEPPAQIQLLREEAVTPPSQDREQTWDIPTAPVENAHNWQVIWGPFNSRISAEGFVKRITRVTGLLFNTVEQSPGEYMVAVAYADDADRLASLAVISAKTGLNLTGLEQ